MAVSSVNAGGSGISRAINNKTEELKKSFNKLSSGLRINSAADDAAGLSVATELLTNAKIDDVGVRNISDAVSAANIADGALDTVSQVVGRLGEIATQAANGTLSDSQRQSLNNEYQSLTQELDRISQSTEFNGLQLLGGNTSVSVQAGGSSDLSLRFPGVSSSSLGLSADLSSQASSLSALAEAKAASDSVAQTRGDIGADVARLDTAFENLRSSSVSLKEAASFIVDVDFAEATSRLTANRIGQQTSVAIQAQANISTESVLRLLSS